MSKTLSKDIAKGLHELASTLEECDLMPLIGNAQALTNIAVLVENHDDFLEISQRIGIPIIVPEYEYDNYRIHVPGGYFFWIPEVPTVKIERLRAEIEALKQQLARVTK